MDGDDFQRLPRLCENKCVKGSLEDNLVGKFVYLHATSSNEQMGHLYTTRLTQVALANLPLRPPNATSSYP